MTEEQASVQIEEKNDKYARFVASPLKKGFGHTLGNSLRRVLLAYLEGAAITAVKIEGVAHEFSSLGQVKEDVLDIIMNLKGVVFKMNTEDNEPKLLRLTVKKEGIVTAGDIALDSDIEVVNPDHYLSTLGKGGKLDVELTVEKGVGYVPVEALVKALPLGTIPMDASFSPVLKVNHVVEDFRVGKKIDYDKLILEVWTNGGMTPEDAVAQSARILQNELSIFSGVTEIGAEKNPLAQLDSADRKQQYGLNLSIEDLELSARSSNCLRKAGIDKVANLIEKDISELMKIKNFGIKSAKEINEKLTQYNLTLKGTLEGIPETDEA